MDNVNESQPMPSSSISLDEVDPPENSPGSHEELLISRVLALTAPVRMNHQVQGYLEESVTSGNLRALKILREKGANVCHRYSDGWSLLHRAAAFGRDCLILYLVHEGLDVNDRWLFWEITPLHVACSNHQVNSAGLLLRLGADLDARDSRGRTPLHVAVQADDLEVIIFLVLTGARLDVEDSSGLTPSRLAERMLRNHQAVAFIEKACLHSNSSRKGIEGGEEWGVLSPMRVVAATLSRALVQFHPAAFPTNISNYKFKPKLEEALEVYKVPCGRSRHTKPKGFESVQCKRATGRSNRLIGRMSPQPQGALVTFQFQQPISKEFSPIQRSTEDKRNSPSFQLDLNNDTNQRNNLHKSCKTLQETLNKLKFPIVKKRNTLTSPRTNSTVEVYALKSHSNTNASSTQGSWKDICSNWLTKDERSKTLNQKKRILLPGPKKSQLNKENFNFLPLLRNQNVGQTGENRAPYEDRMRNFTPRRGSHTDVFSRADKVVRNPKYFEIQEYNKNMKSKLRKSIEIMKKKKMLLSPSVKDDIETWKARKALKENLEGTKARMKHIEKVRYLMKEGSTAVQNDVSKITEDRVDKLTTPKTFNEVVLETKNDPAIVLKDKMEKSKLKNFGGKREMYLKSFKDYVMEQEKKKIRDKILKASEVTIPPEKKVASKPCRNSPAVESNLDANTKGNSLTPNEDLLYSSVRYEESGNKFEKNQNPFDVLSMDLQQFEEEQVSSKNNVGPRGENASQEHITTFQGTKVVDNVMGVEQTRVPSVADTKSSNAAIETKVEDASQNSSMPRSDSLQSHTNHLMETPEKTEETQHLQKSNKTMECVASEHGTEENKLNRIEVLPEKKHETVTNLQYFKERYEESIPSESSALQASPTAIENSATTKNSKINNLTVDHAILERYETQSSHKNLGSSSQLLLKTLNNLIHKNTLSLMKNLHSGMQKNLNIFLDIVGAGRLKVKKIRIQYKKHQDILVHKVEVIVKNKMSQLKSILTTVAKAILLLSDLTIKRITYINENLKLKGAKGNLKMGKSPLAKRFISTSPRPNSESSKTILSPSFGIRVHKKEISMKSSENMRFEENENQLGELLDGLKRLYRDCVKDRTNRHQFPGREIKFKKVISTPRRQMMANVPNRTKLVAKSNNTKLLDLKGFKEVERETSGTLSRKIIKSIENKINQNQYNKNLILSLRNNNSHPHTMNKAETPERYLEESDHLQTKKPPRSSQIKITSNKHPILLNLDTKRNNSDLFQTKEQIKVENTENSQPILKIGESQIFKFTNDDEHPYNTFTHMLRRKKWNVSEAEIKKQKSKMKVIGATRSNVNMKQQESKLQNSLPSGKQDRKLGTQSIMELNFMGSKNANKKDIVPKSLDDLALDGLLGRKRKRTSLNLLQILSQNQKNLDIGGVAESDKNTPFQYKKLTKRKEIPPAEFISYMRKSRSQYTRMQSS